MEEKEMFELQCLALRKDSKMYKDRIEAILLQMEEVAIERDQVGTSRGGQSTPLTGGCTGPHPLRAVVTEFLIFVICF